MDAAVAGRHEAHAGGGVIVESAARACDNFDSRSDAVPVAAMTSQVEHDPVISVQGVIHQDPGLLPKRSDHDVQESVVIQVSKCGASLISQKGKIRSHLLADIDERFSVDIFKHRIALFGIWGEIVHIAVGGVKVLPSVVIIIDESNAPSGKRQAQLLKMGLTGHIVERMPPGVAENAEDLPHEVVVNDIDHAVVIEILGVAAHAGNRGSQFVVGNTVQQTLLLERAIPLIDEQKISFRIVGDENIHQSVAVKVSNRDSHSLAQCTSKPRGIGYILKPPMAQVVVKPLSHALVNCWTAVDLLVRHLAAAIGCRDPFCVVRDDQIQQSIVVVVKPRGADA